MLAGSCLCPDSVCCKCKPHRTNTCRIWGLPQASSRKSSYTSQQCERTCWACLFTLCNECSGRKNKYLSMFCVNQQSRGFRPAQSIELVAVVRLMGSRLCCTQKLWPPKQDINTVLKVDLFTASLKPARIESSGHALRLNSTENLTFNLCPQRDNSSLPPYLGREGNSSAKACAVLWRHEILPVIIQDSWVSYLSLWLLCKVTD